MSPKHLHIHHTKGEPGKEARPRHPDSPKPSCSPHALLAHIPGRGVNAATAKRWRGTTNPAAMATPGLRHPSLRGSQSHSSAFRGHSPPLQPSWALSPPPRLGFLLAPQKPFQSCQFSWHPPWPKLPNSKATFTRGRGSLACYLNSCFHVKPNLCCTIPQTSQCHPQPQAQVSPNFGDLGENSTTPPNPSEEAAASPARAHPTAHAVSPTAPRIPPTPGTPPARDGEGGKEGGDGSPPAGSHPGRGWCSSPAELPGPPPGQGGWVIK